MIRTDVTEREIDLIARVVDVTADDLRDGTMSCTDCPAARAIDRILVPHQFYAIVTYRSIDIARGPQRIVSVPTPPALQPLLIAIDDGRVVAPFQFTLDLPRSVIHD